MLKSRYHVLIWGRTPWSLLHALLLRCRGQDVLVLDDRRLATETQDQRWLTTLELEALRALGEKYRVETLAGVAGFLRTARLSVHLPTLQWASGASAEDNLREYARKLPALHGPSAVDARERAHADLTRATREYWEWLQTAPAERRAAFPGSGVPWINDFQRALATEQARPYQGPELPELAQFLCAHSVALGRGVPARLDAHDGYATALALLSPVWELDLPWFCRELARELTERGGHTKKAGVQSWQTYHGRVEAALLDSYEGVVAHQRLILHGLPPADGHFACRFPGTLYRGLVYHWGQWPHSDGQEERSQLVACTAADRLGTDLPALLVEGGPGGGRVMVPSAERPGSKPAFVHDEAVSLAQAHLARLLPASRRPLELRFAGVAGSWLQDGDGREMVVDRVTREPMGGVECTVGPLLRPHGPAGFLAKLARDLG